MNGWHPMSKGKPLDGPKYGNRAWGKAEKDPERILSDGETIELVATWQKSNCSYKKAANELEISAQNAMRVITRYIRDHPDSLADMTAAAAFLVWVCEVLDTARVRLATDIEEGKVYGLNLAKTVAILAGQEASYRKALQPKDGDFAKPSDEAIAAADEEIARLERGDTNPAVGVEGAEAPAFAGAELESDEGACENGASEG